MMKKLALTALLLAGSCAFAISPAMASGSDSNLSGYGEIFAGYGYGSNSQTTHSFSGGALGSESGSHDQNDLSSLGASGHVNLDLSPSWGLQVDARGQDIAVGSDNETVGGFGAHLYHRSDDALIGGFASLGSAFGSRFGTIGVDSKLFTDSLGIKHASLDFQGSYTGALQGDLQDSRAKSWNLYTGVNYFYTPRLKFSTGAGINWINAHDHLSTGVYHQNLTNVTWNAEVEYQLKDSPVSVFAKYQGNYGDGFNNLYYGAGRDGIEGLNRGHMVSVGLRVYLGGNSLEDNDRHGASFRDHNPIYGSSLL